MPSVILYHDRQISDMKSLCFDRQHGSVIGMDKTYNLGSVYVTACAYKNVALHCKLSGDCPIFLGPIFIHGKSDTESYADFFGHLSAKFMGCDFHAMTLGSDDELAMRKCLVHFSRSQTWLSALVICVRMLAGSWMTSSVRRRRCGGGL